MLTMLFMQPGITSAKAQFDNVLLQNLTTNPKAMYGHARQKSKSKTSVGPLENQTGH